LFYRNFYPKTASHFSEVALGCEANNEGLAMLEEKCDLNRRKFTVDKHPQKFFAAFKADFNLTHGGKQEQLAIFVKL